MIKVINIDGKERKPEPAGDVRSVLGVAEEGTRVRVAIQDVEAGKTHRLTSSDRSRVAYVLEGTDAILLELPGPWFSFEDEVAVTRAQAAVIRSAGFRVVLAHPERSLGVQRRPETLLELVEEGALVCFNADSFVGGHGEACEECGWLLLELGMGDFVASDAHRPERPSRLHEAVEAIAARYGENHALRLAQGSALLDELDEGAA